MRYSRLQAMTMRTGMLLSWDGEGKGVGMGFKRSSSWVLTHCDSVEKKEEGMESRMKHWWWQLGRKLDPDKCHWTCWLCTMNVLWQFSVFFRQGARLLLFYAFQSQTICHIKFTMPSWLLFDNATWVCVNNARYEGWATRCKRLKSVWHIKGTKQAVNKHLAWVRSQHNRSRATSREKKCCVHKMCCQSESSSSL